MQSPSDAELLAEWTARRSEAAFARLVERYVALVHSAARRQVSDPHLAEEITQAVFILLARKAGSLTRRTVLAGWLCRTAHYAARDALKAERRRQQREQLAATMDPPTDAAWQQLAPLLDEAVAQLRESDRNAIVLRYYEQRSLDEVGTALGIGADVAQKRVARALEKLRGIFAKRGVTLTGAAIAGAVSANAIQAVPVGLAAKISAAALVAGTTIAATTAITMTTLQKTIIGAALAAVVGTPLLIQQKALATARSEQAALRTAIREVAIEIPAAPRFTDAETRGSRERADLLRLRREVAALRAQITQLSSQLPSEPRQAASGKNSPDLRGTPIGQTLRLADVRDVGRATPVALLQTYTWAILHGDTNRLTEVIAFPPETDLLKIRRTFEAMSRESAKGTEAMLAGMELSEIRLLEEQPAENNDRWILHELVNKDGEVIRHMRIRVCPGNGGWTVVAGANGQAETEVVEQEP